MNQFNSFMYNHIAKCFKHNILKYFYQLLNDFFLNLILQIYTARIRYYFEIIILKLIV